VSVIISHLSIGNLTPPGASGKGAKTSGHERREQLFEQCFRLQSANFVLPGELCVLGALAVSVFPIEDEKW